MIDCPNAEMRDRLPDVVSGTLSEEERAEVESHVEGCAACRAEVALITRVRAVLLTGAPTIDAARAASIVASLPAAPGKNRRLAVLAGRRPFARRAALRIAAAIVFVAVGGAFVLLREAQRSTRLADSTMIADTQQLGAVETTSLELALPARLDSLSTDQLQTLLKKIDHLDGLPPIVPDVSPSTLDPIGSAPPDTARGSGGEIR